MGDIHDWSEADEIADTIPQAYFKTITNRSDAVCVAKRFCSLGAGQQEIDNLADAVERRAKAFHITEA